MEKVILQVVSALLIFGINLKAQTQVADVINEVFVEDLAGGEKLLLFGLDTTATDGIDPHLGESDLPPFPPAGAFEARFFLPENNFQGTLGSYQDYRQALLPSFDTLEHRLAYQVGTGTVIRITWNFPPDVTGLLQDIITGTLINQPMSDSGSYTVNDPNAFNRLRMMIYYNGTVPVELSSFNANVVGKSVYLKWVTGSEMNNAGFEVGRKNPPLNPLQGEEIGEWEKIGFVQGNGTTSEESFYSFVDNKVEGYKGTIKYRLKQIDFDGTYNYLGNIEVHVDFSPDEFVLYQNYPNPFNPSTVIKFQLPEKSQVKIKVFNLLGQEVLKLINKNYEAGIHNIELNAAELNSGVYFYSLEANGNEGSSFKSTKKMILLR